MGNERKDRDANKDDKNNNKNTEQEKTESIDEASEDDAPLPPVYIPPPKIAFSGVLQSHMARADTDRTVIYDKVNVNLGDCYDVSTGIFTVPIDGTYRVEMNGVSYTNQDVSIRLKKSFLMTEPEEPEIDTLAKSQELSPKKEQRKDGGKEKDSKTKTETGKSTIIKEPPKEIVENEIPPEPEFKCEVLLCTFGAVVRPSGHGSASNSGLFHFTEGDKLSVELPRFYGLHGDPLHPYSTFNVYMMYPDEDVVMVTGPPNDDDD
ncbi:unnamed protein product [Owenia fusiformis]|uniref:Uncharacterized protein n=1 Tax=Owenia fusiformis TaxID=6347 RepID=A0A8J1UGC7_OWEFU|nr:unnamed protein product [Owenia fusiformis]